PPVQSKTLLEPDLVLGRRGSRIPQRREHTRLDQLAQSSFPTDHILHANLRTRKELPELFRNQETSHPTTTNNFRNLNNSTWVSRIPLFTPDLLLAQFLPTGSPAS